MESNHRPSGTDVQQPIVMLYQLSYTAPYIVCLDRGSCRCPTLPKILGYSLMDNSEPLSICTFCLISAFLRLIRLSFSPTSPSALRYYLSSMSCDLSRRSFRIRKLPCRFRLYLRVEYRPFPLRRLVGLFRCRFDSIHVQACALAAVPPQ